MNDPQTEPTVIEQLIRSLRGASRYNRNDADAPAAVLWTDPNSQWRPVAGELRQRMPELLTLGDYLSEDRTGPAIWLRTALDARLPEVEIAESVTPVLYLPGVGRQTLRAVEECPDSLKPLVELQYRGTCWTQRNGKDWTVEAFLTSSDVGLALDVGRDAATRTAMLGALSQLAIEPIVNLKGKRLEREDFDRLLSEDLPRDVLEWLNDPEASRSAWSPSRWTAFRSRCGQELAFDPEEDGELVGAERLGARSGQWDAVWSRFAESPPSYQNIGGLLRQAKPRDLLASQSSWPQSNESKEDQLRQRLSNLRTKSQGEAIAEVRRLEETHGRRRGWVWSKLGQAPLAQALRHISRMAEAASISLGGTSMEELAEQYTASGYEVDNAALDAVATIRSNADYNAVSGALTAIYRPWLEQGATRLQELSEQAPIPTHSKNAANLSVEPGGVILFADGLRFDVSQRLAARMRESGLAPKSSWCWAGLPTVTATGKPAVSPVTELITGASPGDGFAPATVEGRKTLTTDRFRRLLAEAGYEVLSAEETGNPSTRGWTEDGSLDKLGHERKGRLAGHIEEEVELLLERVQALLEAGWQEVRVVTDHGWLWLPGSLPKVSLPHYLTESRWARCAAIREDAKVEVPTSPWYWNDAERVALAPGIACFKSGEEYAHGGLSPQESIVPVITVAAPTTVGGDATIKAISWRGLRCRVQVEGGAQGLLVQLRTKVNDPASAICESREVDSNGIASLLLEDEDHEGSSAVVVVVDANDRAVVQEATIVGGE